MLNIVLLTTVKKSSDQLINIILPDNARLQLIKDRTGRLCGKCNQNKGFSLAIGSSHCIECDNYKGLSLLVFFAAAGFLFVFFINILNLTVAQGMINGLLFYANIIWAYQSEFFPVPQHDVQNIKEWFKDFEYLRVFIA